MRTNIPEDLHVKYLHDGIRKPAPGALKAALLEVQEYVRLQVATLRAMLSPPYYVHDIVEQLDR